MMQTPAPDAMAHAMEDVLLDIPNDTAMPALHTTAQPRAMLRHCQQALLSEAVEVRDSWSKCVPTEAVYQPGRACRIAYQLFGDDPDRPDIVYARWAVEGARDHASAARVETPDGSFELYRYPRDRRLRGIRDMRRGDWLQAESSRWCRARFGAGIFADGSWRCSPIKYVPESRLVCRLKGEWRSDSAGTGPDGTSRWLRAYVRLSRVADVTAQSRGIERLHRAFTERGGPLRIPTVIGIRPDQNLLATDFVRGEAFRDALKHGGGSAIDHAMEALVTVNQVCSDSMEGDDRRPEIAASTVLTELAAANPDNRAASSALEPWSRSRPALPRDMLRIHGDLHAGQLILKGEHVWLVDWDRTRPGDPTRDVMNLAAEFDATDILAAAAPDPGVDHWAVRCVEAWRRAGGRILPASGRWWAVRAHVLRAWGLMRHLRTGWRTGTRKLLERAAAIDARGCDWTG